MTFKFSDKSKHNREGVDFRLIEISDLAIVITLVDFGIPNTGGVRTLEEQGMLFSQGKSKADGIVKKSKHQEGLALDFYAYVDGHAIWEPQYLAMVATAFLQSASQLGYKIRWGGLWSTHNPRNIYGWDMPHIELV